MASKPVPGPAEFNLDDIKAKQVSLSTLTVELKGMYGQIKEQLDQFQTHAITKEEYAERMGKVANDLEAIQTQIEESKNATTVLQERPRFLDYRHMLGAYTPYLIHENKQPFTEVERRAYALFQIPVDYDNMKNGQELRNLRNLHDAFLIYDVQQQFILKNRMHQYNPIGQGLYKALAEGVKEFDAVLGANMAGETHAMAGGNAGFGTEWLPQDFSSEFNDIARITPSLANEFPFWMMSPSATGFFPFQNGKATIYKGSEALVDNADQATKTNIATARKQFTPVPFIGALISSEELVEDALIDMVSFIRNELAVATREALDSAIINGDSTSPHQDNNESTIYASNSVETAFKGLRRIAVDDSATVDIETRSATTGVGALEIANFSELKGMMGVLGFGRDPRESIWISGVRGHEQTYNALLKEDALGILDHIRTGELPTILGNRFHTSGVYNEAQESDGLGGDDADHTSITGVHKPSFRVAQRRGVTLEMDKDILTQQRRFVSTARYDFGKVAPASPLAVVVGINVEHT